MVFWDVLLLLSGWCAERMNRDLFLCSLREKQHAKKKHRLALLELQASAGMQRLLHVLKNVLVGIYDIAQSNIEITREIRSIITSQAHDGIDFIMQRSAFIALAKGTCTF